VAIEERPKRALVAPNVRRHELFVGRHAGTGGSIPNTFRIGLPAARRRIFTRVEPWL
jgi:hypothetical protein